MTAAIPYTTFPDVDLGIVELRTFGLMVALGVLVGARLAARWGERFGVAADETYRVATTMVVGGVVGARLTWVLSHLAEIDSPVDVIAIWEGGLQFSGGFAAAVLLGMPTFLRMPFATRWHALDGYAYGLTIGLALGRVGCYAVGEHLGSRTDFALGVRYEGGAVRESTIGDVVLEPGTVFHHTALYEMAFLVALFAVMAGLRRRADDRPGLVIGGFCVAYGVVRFALDFLRVNDETVLGLTGAQFAMVATTLAGLWVLRTKARPVPEPPVGPDPDR